MAETGIKIKELEQVTTLNDEDDILIDTITPKTMRITIANLVTALSTESRIGATYATKTALSEALGSYVNDVAALIGGDA